MYTKFYSHYLYPFYETVLRGRNTFKLLNEFEANQWRPEEELRRIQWEKFQKMIAHAFEQVPYYRRKFAEAGFHPSQLRSPDDAARIPFLTKKDIQENQEALVAENYRDARFFPSWTGGSTGAPITFKYDRHSYECRIAASARSDRWTGWDFGVREFYIWGVRPTKDSSMVKWKKKIHNAILRRHTLNSYEFSSATLPGFVEEYNRFKPEIIVAYAGAMHTFARFIKDKGLHCHRPRAVIATAEQVFPQQRALIEEVLQAPVYSRYGSREFMVIGMECERREGLHLNIDNQYFEVLRDGRPVAPGETGEIVITDLNNFGMPFIRYKIGDLGVLSAKPCPCGRGLPLLKDVAGRVMEALKTKDGHCVTGLFFTHLMHEFAGVGQFRVVQKSYERLVIEIVRCVGFTETYLDRIRAEIAKTMGAGIMVDFTFVDEIKPLPSGKQCITVSEIPTDFGNG